MKKLLFPLFLLAAVPAIHAETLEIDPSHSAVAFSWNHHGISNPVARFEKIEGKLMLDGSDVSKSSVVVKLALDGLHTAVPALDQRLKTAEFLDAAAYPEITFKSTRIEKGPMGTLKISGDLSLHGVTKPVVLSGKINKINMDPMAKASEAGFDAMVTLKRSDFGVSKFLTSVADELQVHMTISANSEG